MYRELTRSEIVERYERRLAETRRELAEERVLRQASEARERAGKPPWWVVGALLSVAVGLGYALADLQRAVPGPEVLAVAGGLGLLLLGAGLRVAL